MIGLEAILPPEQTQVAQAPASFTDRVEAASVELDKPIPKGLGMNNPFNVFGGAGFTGEMGQDSKALSPYGDTVERPGHMNGMRAGVRLIRNIWAGDVKANDAVPDTDPRRTLRRMMMHYAPPVNRATRKLDTFAACRAVKTAKGWEYPCDNDTAAYIESIVDYLAGLEDGGELRYPKIGASRKKGDNLSIADTDLADMVEGGLDNDQFMRDFGRAIIRHEQGAGYENVFTEDEWGQTIGSAAVSE